jgi:hypothetical protein
LNYFEEELQVGHEHRENADWFLQATIINVIVYIIKDQKPDQIVHYREENA